MSEQELPVLPLDRYRIIEVLGTGGFGAVYKAVDTESRRKTVAVKQVNLRGLSASEIIESTDTFNREIQILSRLKHKQLPRIYDHFSDAEHWYLVMDYIEGQTLDTYIQQHGQQYYATGNHLLPLAEIFEIGLSLCDVLQYLHSSQPAVIFRDLKPGNVMRAPDGELHLIDFGIARLFKPGQAKDTIPFGSPGYAAPEQYGRAQTTPQSDIYSLGVLLHQLLSGHDPSEMPFRFPKLRLEGFAGAQELQRLVEEMIELDPDKRPTSARKVAARLKNIQKAQAEPRQNIVPNPDPYRNNANVNTVNNAGSQQQQQMVQVGQQGKLASRRTVVTLGLAGVGALMMGGYWLSRPKAPTIKPIIDKIVPPTPTATAKSKTQPRQIWRCRTLHRRFRWDSLQL